MSSSPQLAYLDSPASLHEFCAALRDTEWMALDTEFLRERTYYPKFCLLQIATGTQVACIDPLVLHDLDPLRELLFDPGIVKVLHSGRQDLEIFYRVWNRLPAPIFDTQIAAPLIGLPEQVSYAGLVSELLGVSLGKSHTRTDWSLRPLSEAQLKYAADDVIYLGAAYQSLRGKLEALGRLAWLEQDFKTLLDPALYENEPEDAWQRIGGAHQLRGRQLSVLQDVAAWREQTAREQDLPRSWILKDDVLLDLARVLPRTPDDLRRIRGLEERTLKRHGTRLCRLVEDSENRPRTTLDLKPRPLRKTPEQEALLDVLTAMVRLRAAQHTLNPVILAGRKDLEQLLDDAGQSRVLRGWRKAMVGEELAAFLQGECQVAVLDGRLHVKHYA